MASQLKIRQRKQAQKEGSLLRRRITKGGAALDGGRLTTAARAGEAVNSCLGFPRRTANGFRRLGLANDTSRGYPLISRSFGARFVTGGAAVVSCAS